MGTNETGAPARPERRVGAVTLDSIRQVVREELMGTVGSGEVLPPPCNLEYEAHVLGAVLNGYVAHSEIECLDSRHFYSRMYARIYAIARVTLVSEDIALAAFNHGIRGGTHSVTEILHELKQPPDWTDLKTVRYKSERIVELKARRTMMRALNGLAEHLRQDRCNTAGVREALTLL